MYLQKEEVWKNVQHSRVSLAHLLEPPTDSEQPVGTAQAAAKGSAHLRLETRHISSKKSKQVAPWSRVSLQICVLAKICAALFIV